MWVGSGGASAAAPPPCPSARPNVTFPPMQYQGAEDRLNPVAPEDVDESTLGGYPLVHGRAPGFEGADGRPYTAAVETEPIDGGEGWVGYLVFLRWADTGTAIMGHLETEDLVTGASEAEARSRLEAFPLVRIKQILDDAIARKQNDPEVLG
jgi:hypothetical protein